MNNIDIAPGESLPPYATGYVKLYGGPHYLVHLAKHADDPLCGVKRVNYVPPPDELCGACAGIAQQEHAQLLLDEKAKGGS